MGDSNEISFENSQAFRDFMAKIRMGTESEESSELNLKLNTAYCYLTSKYLEEYLDTDRRDNMNRDRGAPCDYDGQAKCTRPSDKTCPEIDCPVWTELFGKLEKEE